MTVSHIGWKRRHVIAGGMAAILVSRTARAMTDYEHTLYEAAKKEGELTWYTAQILGETAQRVITAFNAIYPGIKVNLLRASGQVLYQRVMQEISMNALQGDVIGLSDTGGQQTELKDAGHLMKYRPHRASEVYPMFQNADPDDFFHITTATLNIIVYNTKLVKPEDAPKAWSDLADPKWKGKLAIGHPGFSAMSTQWVAKMNALYGWGFMEKLAKNDTQVTRNINDTVTLVTAGERALGTAPAPAARPGAAKGNPIAVIYPSDGTMLAATSTGIAAVTKHPNAAKLMMEFLLGPECARVLVNDYGDSIRPDVPALNGQTMADVKLIVPTAEENRSMGTLIEPFRNLFGF
jgi:iron(III) transport system substrate-binding protein